MTGKAEAAPVAGKQRGSCADDSKRARLVGSLTPDGPPWYSTAAFARNVQQHWKGLGGPGTLGIEIVLSVAVGLLGGSWLDKRFGSSPWFTLIGLAYGLAAAGRAIYRALKQANADLAELEKKEREQRQKFDDDTPPNHS